MFFFIIFSSCKITHKKETITSSEKVLEVSKENESNSESKNEPNSEPAHAIAITDDVEWMKVSIDNNDVVGWVPYNNTNTDVKSSITIGRVYLWS